MAEPAGFRIQHGFEVIPGGAPESAPADLESSSESVLARAELRSVIEFLRALGKAIKAARMYPANNPIYARFQSDLFERLSGVFTEFNGLRLVVGQNRLFFQGEMVYENADPEDSLARLFFRDGIRELTFHLGLEREEMGRFLEMARRAATRDSNDDLVTQLWDDALPHVTYIAIDDMLDQDLGSEPVPAEFGSDFMNYVDFEIDFSDPEEEAEVDRNEAMQQAGELHKRLLENGDRTIISISDAEEALLKPEVETEDEMALVGRVLHTFFDTLEQDDDPAAREVIFAVLGKAVMSLVAQRQWRTAGMVLTMATDLARRRPDLAGQHEQSLRAIFQTSTDDARLTALTESLNRPVAALAETEEAYLSVLPDGAVPALCRLLGDVESRRGRMMVVNALVRLGQGNVELFYPYLRDERSFVVQNILMVLGRMKATGAVRQIKPLVTHDDLNVRREALAALSQIGEGEALDVLLALLRDPDPRMRVSAARSLSQLGKRAVNPLLGIVLAREFEERGHEERRGFFEALGRTNAPDLLPFLRMLLSKKPLFKKKEAEEMRVCAVEALSRMRGPEVKPLLDMAAQDPSSLVRAAVTGAQRRQDEETDEL